MAAVSRRIIAIDMKVTAEVIGNYGVRTLSTLNEYEDDFTPEERQTFCDGLHKVLQGYEQLRQLADRILAPEDNF